MKRLGVLEPRTCAAIAVFRKMSPGQVRKAMLKLHIHYASVVGSMAREGESQRGFMRAANTLYLLELATRHYALHCFDNHKPCSDYRVSYCMFPVKAG